MRLAIVGSRNFRSQQLIARFVSFLKPETVVVSGGARGVDRHAVAAAEAAGLTTEVFWPNWDGLGKKAGPERNMAMIATVDGVVAFHDGSSPGTAHAIYIARKWKKWLRIYREDGTWTDHNA